MVSIENKHILCMIVFLIIQFIKQTMQSKTYIRYTSTMQVAIAIYTIASILLTFK